jgi:hypothetical protein
MRRPQKRDFHFQGIRLGRLDVSGFLCLAVIFSFVAWAFSVDSAALIGTCFLVGWLVGKAA